MAPHLGHAELIQDMVAEERGGMLRTFRIACNCKNTPSHQRTISFGTWTHSTHITYQATSTRQCHAPLHHKSVGRIIFPEVYRPTWHTRWPITRNLQVLNDRLSRWPEAPRRRISITQRSSSICSQKSAWRQTPGMGNVGAILCQSLPPSDDTGLKPHTDVPRRQHRVHPS